MRKSKHEHLEILSYRADHSGNICYYPYTVQMRRTEVFSRSGDWNRAGIQYSEILNEARLSGQKRLIAECANQLGFLLMQRGDFRAALTLFEESFSITQELGLGDQACNVIGNLGNVYRNMGEYDKAEEYYKQALSLAKTANDRNLISIISGNLGLMYWYKGEHDRAMECNRYKMQIDIEDNNLHLIGTDYANLGGIYFSLGQYNLSEDCYLKQISLARQIGDKYSLRVALNNLAGIYDYSEDYEKALECYEQSLAIARELGQRGGERVVLNNLGKVISYRGDYGAALTLIDSSLAIALDMGDRRGEGIVRYTRGNVCFDQGDITGARESYLPAKSIFQELSLKEYLCECLGDLAKVELAAANYGLARQYYQESRQLAESMSRVEYLVGLDKTDAEIALALGEIAPGGYESRISPLVVKAPARLQAEFLIRLWQVTRDIKYAENAKDIILSRPNWSYRKDYREWVKEIDNG